MTTTSTFVDREYFTNVRGRVSSRYDATFSRSRSMTPNRPFASVYSVPELAALVMDSLTLSALIAMSFTCKANFRCVQSYIQHKLKRILVPFGLHGNNFMSTLRFTNAVVVGSIALKAVAPATWSIVTNNLDIVVESTLLHIFENWLVYRGYQPKEPNHSSMDYAKPFEYCKSFTRRVNGQDKDINFLVPRTKSELYEFIFFAPDTASMNAITHDGLFNAYRSLLDCRLAVRNHATHMSDMFTHQESTRIRQSNWETSHTIKTISRGFTFVGSSQSHSWPTRCDCTRLTACPLTLRHTNDNMCSFFPLVSDDGISEDAIPVYVRRPEVVWRLAEEPREGLKGFGRHMFVE